MQDFLSLFNYSFFQHILIIAVLSSVLSSLAGTFLEFNNLSSMAGAISHAILAGVGVATFYNFSPFYGSLIAATICAIVLAYQTVKDEKKTDILSNILWGGGMALGVLFISFTKGYQQNISNFLFGNILLISKTDILQVLTLDIFLFFIISMFFKQLVLLAFNKNFARVQGLPLFKLYFILILIISFAIINLVKTVGIALALILLNVPTHIARKLTSSIITSIILAALISFLSILIGLYLSYQFNFPAGSITALVCIGFYVVLGIKNLFFYLKSRF